MIEKRWRELEELLWRQEKEIGVIGKPVVNPVAVSSI